MGGVRLAVQWRGGVYAPKRLLIKPLPPPSRGKESLKAPAFANLPNTYGEDTDNGK